MQRTGGAESPEKGKQLGSRPGAGAWPAWKSKDLDSTRAVLSSVGFGRQVRSAGAMPPLQTLGQAGVGANILSHFSFLCLCAIVP